MTTQNRPVQQITIVEEIIDNAITLPVGSQEILLMLAKAMRHTRGCLMQQGTIEQPRRPPGNKTT